MRRLATLALLVATVPGVAAAQGAKAAPAPVSVPAASDRPDLEQAAKYIFARLSEHRERIDRMDQAIEFFRKDGNTEKMRSVEGLREREKNAFQQTLAEYQRLLGERDFNRVITSVRDRVSLDEPTADGPGGARTERKARPTEELAKPNPRGSFRRMEAARARASQRAQLAARMKEATSGELRRRAQAARSVNPRLGTTPANGRKNDRIGGLNGATTGNRNQAQNPYKRPRGRP